MSNLPSGGPERKEVISRSQRAPRAQVSRQKTVNGKIRNALLLAGGLNALGASVAVAGCGDETGSRERTGRVSQALASGWNVPTSPSLGLSGATKIAFVERSGSNITLYVTNNSSGNFDIKKVGTADGGLNWNSPAATAVPGANSVQKENDFKICGPNAYIVSGRDGLSDKLYAGSWAAGTVGALSPVGGSLNDDFATVTDVACNSAGTKIYAASDILTINKKILTADIGTWTWSELSTCNDATKNTYGMFVDTSDFYVVSDRTGTLGSVDLMVYNGGWNGVNCSGGVTNLNAVAGSAAVNNVSAQGSMVIDNTGDLWYADNGTIKWASKLTGGGDGGGGAGGDGGTPDAGGGGADAGAGGDAGAPPDAGGGGADAGGGSDAGVGGDGGTGGVDAGTGGDAGAGGTDAGGSDAGAGGEGGTDAGTGGDGGTGGVDAGTGGDTGTGGTDAGKDCTIVNITQNKPNFQVDSCSDTELKAKLLGPTTFVIGTKTFTVTNVVPNSPNGFTYTMPQYPVFENGIELEEEENEPDPTKKIVDDQWGEITGYEGTKVRKFVPEGTLNPNKNSGEIRVVATTTMDGLQRKYVKAGCDKTQLEKCTPDSNYKVEGFQIGQIPKGTTMYKDLITGKVSENPADFQTIPPVTDKPSEDEGCSVSGHVGSTRNDLAILFAGLGIAAVMRRRK